MAYWEFLLQKEGDRDWLPLETSHVEISEGRYRIIAHTSYCNTPVNIRLSRLLTEPMPPQRKSLRRVGSTNTDGLMVVIPFTHLTPGHWTVTCSAAAEISDAPWEFGVQLEVLAIESGVEYWDTELDEASFAEQFANPAQSSISDESWSLSAAPTASTTADWESFKDNPETPFAVQTPLEDLPLRLQLQHQALVAQTAAPLSLQGQVTTFSEVEGLAGEGTLWVQLRDPETGMVIHQSTQAISIAALPSRFDVAIALPAESSTRLLVGELSLWTAAAPPQILAIQGFTVTLNLDALLELVANQAERATATDFDDLASPAAAGDTVGNAPSTAPPATADAPSGATGGVVSPLSPRSVPFRLIYLPSSGLTLPPVIYRPIDKKSVGSPTLPFASTSQRRDRSVSPPSPNTANADNAASKPLALPNIGSDASSAAPKPPEPAANQGPPVELPTIGKPPKSSPASAFSSDDTASQNSEISSASPSQPTFEPDLQGRFWHRLSALAEEAQKAAADYKAQLEAAGVDETVDETAGIFQRDPAIADRQPEAPVNYEVVVYDLDDEPVVSGLSEATADSEPLVEVLQPGEPDRQELGEVPVPAWVFPQGELIAGTPLPITVHLPAYPRRLAVKVWVTDIQSRTLIDRPRWLMNWTPTPEGDQTAFLQLQVPLGSIEARFEAITIDLATQQESYKTSIVREIQPPNFPESAIDEPL